MSNAIRLELAPRPRFASAQPPAPRPVPPMIPADAREAAPAPAAPARQARQGVLEHVYFDGPMQLELWWEGEALPHPGAIELR